MEDDDEIPRSRNRKRLRLFLRMLAWTFGFLLLLLFLALLGLTGFTLQIPYLLICGWIHFLATVLPLAHVNLEMIFTGIGAFVLAVLISHLVLRWFWYQRSADQSWRWRWTLCLCFMVPVLFGISIAVGGVLHQAGWLMHQSPWYEDKSRGRLTKCISNARQTITVLKMWADDHGGRYPDRLEQLFTDEVLDNNRILYYVPREGDIPELLEYLPGLTDSDPGFLPVVIGPHGETQGRWIMGMNDGSVAIVKPEDFAKAMLKYRQHTSASKSKTP